MITITFQLNNLGELDAALALLQSFRGNKAASDDPRVDADEDVVPSPPGGLADAAAMSNHELFTAVIASIRRDGTGAIKNRRKGGGDKKKKNGGDDDRGGGKRKKEF